MNRSSYDIAIVGGGASGLCAAAYLKKYSKKLKIAVIDKETRVGKRLLATGNGKCNLTNMNLSAKNYRGTGVKYIDELLCEYTPKKLRDEFNSFGLLTREDSCGRVYPYSGQASSVLDILRNYTDDCEIIDTKITTIKKDGKFFRLTSKNTEISAKKVILACGGKVQPNLGADGSGYALAKSFGHTIINQVPSLAPVVVKDKNLPSLKGIRTQCDVTLVCKGENIITEKGELQFADNALSGICIFQLSPYVNKYLTLGEKDMYISVNLMPEYSRKEIVDIITKKNKINSDCTLENLFTGIINKRIGTVILKMLRITPLSEKCNTLSESQIESIADTISNIKFYPSQISDINKAQVTCGGVCCDEINFSTMESKLVKGLYLAGEMTDIDGDCGGYNLHYAFSTGLRCAKSCIKELIK